MAKRRIRKLCSAWVAIAFASTTLLVSAQPASAEGALFRAKRTWWFSQAASWTDGHVIPPAGTGKDPYEPPSVAYVGNTHPVRGFTAPKSFIKNTTYYFTCGFFGCFVGYPHSSWWSSYWNAKGSFRANNPNAPTTTTTVRMRTTADGYDPSLMGWPTVMRYVAPFGMVTLATPPPTAMGNPLTPTTTWGGRYDHSRGGSIMIWPGPNRFGGTMRFFEGPNIRYYAYRPQGGPGYPYLYTITFPAKPLSKQIGTGVEFSIGEVTETYVGFRFQLTRPYYRDRLIIGTTSMGGPQYAVRTAHYLVTRAPYTTGKVQIWEPNGDTNTIQTATGYDNRTPAGLNGNISLVHPRLVHAYTVFPPGSGEPITMSWSAARARKIDFRFLPEPHVLSTFAAGIGALWLLRRLRRRVRSLDSRGLLMGRGRGARSI